jgi:hypothetical protein
MMDAASSLTRDEARVVVDFLHRMRDAVDAIDP